MSVVTRVRKRDTRYDDPSIMPPQTRKPGDPHSIGGVPVYIPSADLGPNQDPFSNLPSVVQSKFDNDKGYKINLDSNGPLNIAVQMSNLTQKSDQNLGKMMIMFARSQRTATANWDMGSVDLMSWSALGHSLKYDYRMLCKYDSDTCRELMNDWRYVGTQQRDKTMQITLAMHFFRRAIVYNMHCALNNKTTQNASVRPHDDLWILVVRRDVDFGADKMENQVSGYAPGAKIPKHYWKLLPWVSTNGKRPRYELYSQEARIDPRTNKLDEGWVGDCICLGTIARTFGDKRSMSNAHCDNARYAICPETLDDDAKRKYYSLNTLEIFRL